MSATTVRMQPARDARGWWAFLGHRLSGIALALFLPLHFLVLGLALEGAQALDAFLAFGSLPLVKFAEWGLVVLLALHLGFGLRVLWLEFGPWAEGADPMRLRLVLPVVWGAVAVGGVFLWASW